nr:hypothetical protein [Tanacetum cinerariifolium]
MLSEWPKWILVGKGSVVSVTADADCLSHKSNNPLMACEGGPKGMLYLLYVITSSQSSIFTACGVVAACGAAGPDVAGPSNLAGTERSTDTFMFLKTWTPRLFLAPPGIFPSFLAVEVARVSKLNILKEQNIALGKEKNTLKGHVLSCDELSAQSTSLESERDGLIDQVFFVVGHMFRTSRPSVSVINLRSGATFGAVIGLTIDKGIQAGLAAGINHVKAKIGLADVASYDPSMEKDASIADIMSLLRLEGPSIEASEISWLQPSYEQLLPPIHRKKDNVVGETSLSDSLNVVHDSRTSGVPATVAATTTLSVSVTVALVSSIPPISVTDYEALDAEPQPETSHSPKVMFEKETLETTPEHPTTN